MTNLFQWLLSAVGPLAIKVLAALGIGVISYAGLSTLARSVITQAQGAFGQISGSILQFLSLVGAPEVFGIISGAIMARVALFAIKKFGFLSA